MTRERTLRGFLGFMALGVFGVIGLLFLGATLPEYLQRRPFDHAVWQDKKAVAQEMRIRMVDDLLRSRNFRGMTRAQVTAILGESDQTAYFSDWDMVYWLGPERDWFSIDSEWLVLRFDDSKKIAEFRIVRD